MAYTEFLQWFSQLKLHLFLTIDSKLAFYLSPSNPSSHHTIIFLILNNPFCSDVHHNALDMSWHVALAVLADRRLLVTHLRPQTWKDLSKSSPCHDERTAREILPLGPIMGSPSHKALVKTVKTNQCYKTRKAILPSMSAVFVMGWSRRWEISPWVMEGLTLQFISGLI